MCDIFASFLRNPHQMFCKDFFHKRRGEFGREGGGGGDKQERNGFGK